MKNFDKNIDELKNKYALKFLKEFEISECAFLYDVKRYGHKIVAADRGQKNGRNFLNDGNIFISKHLDKTDLFEPAKSLSKNIGSFVYLPFCYNKENNIIIYADAENKSETVLKKVNLHNNSIIDLNSRKFGNNVKLISFDESVFISDFSYSDFLYQFNIKGELLNKINFISKNYAFPLEIIKWNSNCMLISFGNQHISNAKSSVNIFSNSKNKNSFSDTSLALWDFKLNTIDPIYLDNNIWPRSLHRDGSYLWASNYNGDLIKYQINDNNLETVFKVNLNLIYPFNQKDLYRSKFRMFIYEDLLYIYLFAESNVLYCFKI